MKTLKTAFEDRKALITYISAGDPDIGTTAYLLQLLDREGVDILEVGIPFSDPLADGPVIQQAGQRALAGGATLRKILDMLAGLRDRISAPRVLMGYMNPIIAYGPEKFAADAADAGAAGVIIPDLPFHQSEPLASLLREKGIDLILTSHYTPEDLKDAGAKIGYLETLKEIAGESADAYPFVVDLRNIGKVHGRVAWARGKRFGLNFDKIVDPKLARAPVGTGPSEAPRYARPAVAAPPAAPDARTLRKL